MKYDEYWQQRIDLTFCIFNVYIVTKTSISRILLFNHLFPTTLINFHGKERWSECEKKKNAVFLSTSSNECLDANWLENKTEMI